MRILDANDSELMNPDLELGYLQDDRVFLRSHAPTAAVQEKGHWHVLQEYPCGGQDLEWIVDVPGQPAREAWDEYEEVQRYVPYSREELAQREAQRLRARRLEILLQEDLAELVANILIKLLPKLLEKGVGINGDH